MKKGILSVMAANIFCLILSLLTNFLLPKYLTVDTYGMLKTYTLYLSYAGFFHLGYCDGMYLKYGGQDLRKVKGEDLSRNFFNYVVIVVMMAVIILGINIFINDSLVFAFAFGMLFYNTLGYLKYLYQATGEFSSYSKALNTEKFAVFFFNVIFIFALGLDNYLFYVWIQIVVSAAITVILLYKLDKQVPFIKGGKLSFHECKENILSGFTLMIGNFSSNIFTGLDRWFVKILLSTTHFALYSFAVSIENLMNVFISPITLSMYNYFCKAPEKEDIYKIKKMVLLWGFFIIAAAFPAKFILEIFLTDYIDASKIIFFLFAAQAFYVVIKGVHINIYKAEKQQTKYLKQTVLMTIVGFFLNYILYFAFKNMESIACATLLTAAIWYVVCEKSNPEICFKSKETIYIVLMMIVFLTSGFMCQAIGGCVVYCVSYLVIGFIFMRNELLEVLSLIKSLIFKVMKK